MKRALAALVATLGMASLAGFAVPVAPGGSDSSARRVDVVIEAQMGRFTPSVIRVHPGDTVHVTLKTRDIPHGFSLVGHDVNIVAMPNRPAEATFVVNSEARMYEWFCTARCGRSHGRMTGSLIALDG